jgi:hypothetical protein
MMEVLSSSRVVSEFNDGGINDAALQRHGSMNQHNCIIQTAWHSVAFGGPAILPMKVVNDLGP